MNLHPPHAVSSPDLARRAARAMTRERDELAERVRELGEAVSEGRKRVRELERDLEESKIQQQNTEKIVESASSGAETRVLALRAEIEEEKKETARVASPSHSQCAMCDTNRGCAVPGADRERVLEGAGAGVEGRGGRGEAGCGGAREADGGGQTSSFRVRSPVPSPVLTCGWCSQVMLERTALKLQLLDSER